MTVTVTSFGYCRLNMTVTVSPFGYLEAGVILHHASRTTQTEALSSHNSYF
jgi:hypothetical protein